MPGQTINNPYYYPQPLNTGFQNRNFTPVQLNAADFARNGPNGSPPPQYNQISTPQEPQVSKPQEENKY